jgi:hypothetical protein
MKQLLHTLALLLLAHTATAQYGADTFAVKINAYKTQAGDVGIYWKKIPSATSYTVHRKTKTATSWGTALATVPAADSFYVDATLTAGKDYEYSVTKNGGTVSATGYIHVGNEAAPIHNRGTLQLLVDNTFATPCSTAIYQLMKDLAGDGWEVVRNDFDRTATDVTIRNQIIATKAAHSDLNAVLIVGRIAVPYSGNIAPDGHTPDHQGAWPADCYYADVNDTWTDANVNTTGATGTRNDNTPGDGKWDQNTIAGDLELQVGRIDFANMPMFAATTTDEASLLNTYLARLHDYKMTTLAMNKRALIDDNFGAFNGEAFAQNGWRNFSPLVGLNAVFALDYSSTLNTDTYQWAYGCGAGSYTSCNGVATSTDFTTKQANAIFSMMFGSYFGDWGADNSLLRAPMCSSVPVLASVWAGRPNVFLHHMALGENIGYSMRLSQNNNSLYAPTNYGARFVHPALMGDVSLRTEYVAPPTNVVVVQATNGADISWTASADPDVTTYALYRSNNEFGPYTHVASVTGTTANDIGVGLPDGNTFYMVRAGKLQQTPSGSYVNLGIGVVDSEYIDYPVSVKDVANNYSLKLYPNPVAEQLNVSISIQKYATAELAITDIYGRTIWQQSSRVGGNNNVITIDVAHLPAGIYMLQTNIGGQALTEKWIKLPQH